MNERVPLKGFDVSELICFYDEFIKDRKILMPSEQASKIWWAMFYAWKEGKDWIIYNDAGDS